MGGSETQSGRMIAARVGDVFAVEVRSLALFRVALGALLLADLVARSFDFQAHYTDFGVLPRWVLLRHQSEWYFSLHMISGAWPVQAGLFLLAGAAAGALIIGWRTRQAVVLLWMLTLSLHIRNPMVLYGADAMIQAMLLWSLFVPLGACWSVDRRLSGSTEPATGKVTSVGSAAFVAQVIFVYVFSALLKTGPPWADGTAIYYALSVDHIVRPLGKMLLDYPTLMMWGTYGVYYLELIGPLFLLCPLCVGPVRMVVIVLFMLLHLSLGLCLKVGLFPLAGVVLMLPLLPSCFWELRAVRRIVTRLGEITGSTLTGLDRLFGSGLARPPRMRQTWLGAIVCLSALAYVLLWNIATLPKASGAIPTRLVGIGWMLGLEQRWDMFAPQPMTDDGWFVLPAVLRDGTELDLITREPVSWDKPELASDLHWSDRWQKYMRNLWERDKAWNRVHFGRYLCRDWNSTAPEARKLETFDVYFMLEVTAPPGETATIEEVLLWEHTCFP